MNKPRKQSGQSLVEAVAAIALTAVVVVVLSTLAIGSLRNAYFAKQQNLASFYAQQGIELVRSIRDQDRPISGWGGAGVVTKWSDLWGVNIVADGDLFKLSGTTLQHITAETFGEVLPGRFTRTVRIFDDSGGVSDCVAAADDWQKIKRVLVKVSWKDNKSELSTCLTKIENLKS